MRFLVLLSVVDRGRAQAAVHLARACGSQRATTAPVFSSRLRSPVTGREHRHRKGAGDLGAGCGRLSQPIRLRTAATASLFHLNDHGKLALDTLSIERRGTSLFVFVNGRLLDELQIDRRVSDGKLYIAAGLTQADIELMKKEWPATNAARKKQ